MNAVVFDLDGTLIDSHRDIAEAVNDVLVSLELPPHDPESVKTMIGGGVATLLSRALGEERMHLFDRARARFKDAYAARLTETTRLYDGVAEMLEELARGGTTSVVATNKPSFFTKEIAARLRLQVAAFACSDEVRERKPDPAVVRLALERAGVDAGSAYVGDMPIDVETARRAALPFLGVAWGFDPRGLIASGCERIFDQPRGLVEALRSVEEKARTSINRDR